MCFFKRQTHTRNYLLCIPFVLASFLIFGFLFLQTGLHLVTGNTSSDQSIVEDGLSPNSEDKRAKTEVLIIRNICLPYFIYTCEML